jgi:hypothetical protein
VSASLVYDIVRSRDREVRSGRRQQLSQILDELLEKPDIKAVLVPVADHVHYCGVLIPKDRKQPWLHIETYEETVSLPVVGWLTSCLVVPASHLDGG